MSTIEKSVRLGTLAADRSIPVLSFVAYSGPVMSRSRQQRAWKMIAASAVLFALLLILLPHPHYLTVAAIYPVLAVVFLFGAVHVPYSLWILSHLSETHLPQSPDLPSRFQRPPPADI
jgi:hypothetical protein